MNKGKWKKLKKIASMFAIAAVVRLSVKHPAKDRYYVAEKLCAAAKEGANIIYKSPFLWRSLS